MNTVTICWLCFALFTLLLHLLHLLHGQIVNIEPERPHWFIQKPVHAEHELRIVLLIIARHQHPVCKQIAMLEREHDIILSNTRVARPFRQRPRSVYVVGRQ